MAEKNFEKIPQGTYVCTVERVFYGETKSSGKPMVSIWYRIQDPTSKFNRFMMFDRTVCSSEKAWAVARAKLAALFNAIPDDLNADNAAMICDVVKSAATAENVKFKVDFKLVQGNAGQMFERHYAERIN